MSDSLLSRNLVSLRKTDAALCDKITEKISTHYRVTKSRSGPPTLIHIDSEGNKKQINSNYDPIAEAARYLETFRISESINFVVLGLGLGYQVMEIIQKTSKQAKIYIFEKDPELFALALREIDFSPIFEHPGVKLFVDANPLELDDLLESERINFTLNEYCLVRQKSLVEKNLEYYGVLLEEIEKYFSESRINLKTQSVHSKLYYRNIFSNFENLLTSPGITSLKNSLPGIPAVICSAGPSLDKNIQLLKSARENIYLIAVGTALKPLFHNGIQPDVVISIDPDEETVKCFDLTARGSDLWLVYSPAVPNAIPNAFPDRRLAFDSQVYLAEWLKKYTQEKGDLGKVTSVAHSAVKFAHYLSCSPIILVGQDLSFCKQRLHCKHSYYYDEHMGKVDRLKPLTYWSRLKYAKHGPSLTQGIDLFGGRVASTLAMESYNHVFSQNSDAFVVNATEGGVPIKGVQNLTLREALHCYCRGSFREQHNTVPRISKKDSLKVFQESALRQIHILKDISAKLKALKCLETKTAESKRLFVDEMETLYKNILENEETALLLQGYDFSGFSDWYRTNSEILRKKDCNMSDEKFQRDLKLCDVLVGCVDYLLVNLKKSLSH